MKQFRDYDNDAVLVKQFLTTFETNTDDESVPKYKDALTMLANRQKTLLVVELADLERFDGSLSDAVVANTPRYVKIFYQILEEILPSYQTVTPEEDIYDLIIEQRKLVEKHNKKERNLSPTRYLQSTGTGTPLTVIDGKYPPGLNLRAEIVFKPSSVKLMKVWEVSSKHVGRLITIRGLVLHTSDVKPMITIVCYICDKCNDETFQPVEGLMFTPEFHCTSRQCSSKANEGRLNMVERGHKFIKFQEIQVQEHQDNVPVGCIARSIKIVAHGEITDLCTPGDQVMVTGIPLERSDGLERNKVSDLFIQAHQIVSMFTIDDQLYGEPMSAAEAHELRQSRPNFRENLCNSIAPEIKGCGDLKEVLMLALIGANHKNARGMTLRGNINVCIIGDPGTSKSQLLNFIHRLVPRSQYASGRGSSSAGLTAACTRDSITGEMILEAGALVMADGSICCIDEFDKMLDIDRVALHEIMENQTASIAKAGINTTLNARVTIIAAANPAYGRYNNRRSLVENINMPPALLSRFDLIWILKDERDSDTDDILSRFVASIHAGRKESGCDDVIDMQTLLRFIGFCKTIDPSIPQNLDKYLVDEYVKIRAKRRDSLDTEPLFTSPRSLLALIRLALALARLRLSDTVGQEDIDEAVRLYQCSHLQTDELVVNETNELDVLKLIKELAANNTCLYDNFIEQAEERGLNFVDLEESMSKLIDNNYIKIEHDRIIVNSE